MESALALNSTEERERHPELESTMAEVQKELGDRLEQALSWLPVDGADAEEFAPGRVVPRRLVERDPPGLAGTGYWELHQMAGEMQARDPKVNYDSLRIIGDEIWNFADGALSVNEIAEAVGAEFDFDLEPRHVLKLFQGLAVSGFVDLAESSGLVGSLFQAPKP